MAIPFFLTYQVIAGWLILNLIIAAIIDGLSNAQKDRESLISQDSINQYLQTWQKFDPELKWTMKFSDIWLFIAELKHPFNEKNLKFKWNPETEPKEPRYFYCNAEDYPDDVGGTSSYKVKRYDCFTLLKDQNTKFKVQSKQQKVAQGSKYVSKTEHYVDFNELTTMIMKKAFILAEAGDDGQPDESSKINAKEKMKLRIEKAKTLSKISQQIMSERGIHYQPDDPIKQLAAQMIQDAAKAKFDFENIQPYRRTDESQKNLIIKQSKFSGNIQSSKPKYTQKTGTGKDGLKTKVMNRGNTVNFRGNQRFD